MATEITDFSTTPASNTANWPEGMLPSAVNDAGREDEAILAKWFGDTNGSLASGGSSNAYTLTLNQTKFEVSSAYDGFPVAFQANHANTGAATLNITPAGGAAKGAKSIVKYGNTALASGDIASGQVVCLVYDNSQDNFQMVSPPGTSGISSIVEDTTPQLGGDLDLNGNNIDFPTTANISDCLDEDDMASDSATVLATQQSIKAYVDTQVAASSSPIPSGTVMLFMQAATPTGWTRENTVDDRGLRIIGTAGTGAGTGGATGFTTVFGSGKTTGADAGTTPAHTHDVVQYSTGSGGTSIGSSVFNATTFTLSPPTSAGGAGGTHTHTVSLDLNYVNVIHCSKDA